MSDLTAMLRAITACPSRRELWALMISYYAEHGVVMASYHACRSDGTPYRVITEGVPESWLTHYEAADLARIDPFPTLAATLGRPFHWHEIPELTGGDEGALRFLAEMRCHGIGDGLAFYVYGPGARNAYVGLCFGAERVEIDPDLISAMQCVGQAGHVRVCALTDVKKNAAPLTRRETEVLRWVTRGKSNASIATILGVSTHTVDALLRRIYAKLDVTDRTTAAIRGIGSGIIHDLQR